MKSLQTQLKLMARPHETHELKDVLIHQVIHTIEIVLGCVSHTASYLRLWALSLAHGQLSQIIFNLTMKDVPMIGTGVFKLTETSDGNVFKGVIFGILSWPLFFFGTFAFILMLDAIECFLHTVRLHWVEFNSKFYKGQNALKYNPFSFNSAMQSVVV